MGKRSLIAAGQWRPSRRDGPTLVSLKAGTLKTHVIEAAAARLRAVGSVDSQLRALSAGLHPTASSGSRGDLCSPAWASAWLSLLPFDALQPQPGPGLPLLVPGHLWGRSASPSARRAGPGLPFPVWTAAGFPLPLAAAVLAADLDASRGLLLGPLFPHPPQCTD